MNLLIGDSHIFTINIDSPHDLVLLHGASACGLDNAQSVSSSQKQILDCISNKKYNRIFLNFGNVDVSHIFIFKLCKNNMIDYRVFNQDVVKRYISFIENHLRDYKVICLSVGLPPLDDAHLIENIILCYKHKCLTGRVMTDEELKDMEILLNNTQLPDIHARTKIVVDFNTRLKGHIDALGNKNISFLDVTTFTYDPEKLRIKDEFYTKNDIHNFERNITVSSILNSYIDQSSL